MMTRSGRVVVMDLGIARGLDGGTHGARSPGTPAYMAPEQARGEAVDGARPTSSRPVSCWRR